MPSPFPGMDPYLEGSLWMTVNTQLSAEIARQLGYDIDASGVVVTAVDPTSLAARAGIRSGDMLVAIGGADIESVSDFREAMRDHDPESGIRMQILRDGVRRFVFLRSR